MNTTDINLIIKENEDLVTRLLSDNKSDIKLDLSWDTYWYRNDFYLNVVTFHTAFTRISVRMELLHDKDRLLVIVQVSPYDRAYSKLESLSCSENYTDFKIEYLTNAIKYAWKIMHLIFQKEDLIQKIIGTTVREGKLLKDFH